MYQFERMLVDTQYSVPFIDKWYRVKMQEYVLLNQNLDLLIHTVLLFSFSVFILETVFKFY